MTVPRRLVVLLGAAGGFILVHQLVELGGPIAAADLSTPAGRMRLITTVWTRGAALLAADLFLIWAAVAGAHRRSLAVLALIHLVVGAAMVVDAPFFLIDAGRMASSIGGDAVAVYRLVVARALGMLAVLGVAALVAGWSLRLLARDSSFSES